MTLEMFNPIPPEYHFGYGMTGVGRCAKCNSLRTLFVISALHTADDCEPLCHSCIGNDIERNFHVAKFDNDDQEQANIWYTLYHAWENNSANLQHSRAEVLAHPQGCQACARFGEEFVEARDQDGNIGRVHAGHSNCYGTCYECSENYFMRFDTRTSGSWFHSSSALNRILTADSDRIERVCTSCLDAHEDLVMCDCGVYELDDRMEYFDGLDVTVCRHCSQNITECGSCGSQIWDDGDHECEDSYRVIKSFDFRPVGGFTFHGEHPHDLHMGFELEVESMDNSVYDNASAVNNVLARDNRGFLKQDGSLSDGFEIVTQPHTLEEYMTNFPWYLVDDLRRNGFRSWDTDTCGFHIHVSRKAFGWQRRGEFNRGKYEAHLVRFTKLIYDNQRQVRIIAGRNSRRWAAFDDKGRLFDKVKTGYQANSRYSAVNVANTDTIEIRVFKGSLNVNRLKACLQFVASATEYTRDLHVSPNDNNLRWTRYRGWLQKHDEQYPELINLLSTRSQGDE